MLQHLTNCHGEWNLFFALLGSLPFIGLWFKMKIQNLRKNKGQTDESR